MRSPLIMDKVTGTRTRRKRGAGAEDMEDTIVLQPLAATVADNPSTSDGTIKNESNLQQSALMDELDKEIDRQLKARRTELTVKYVKNLIKAAMNTQYLLMSNNCKLNTAGKISQKPILTRSKIRELLAKEYNLLIPKPLQTNDPDIAELITKELPDDSSDEEYHPNDMSDDESNINEKHKHDEDKIQSDIKSKPLILNQDNHFNIDENIGQRTRSKLCLSETPLEAIEQAFIPPDITKDMYNLECENPDWFDFLKEFTQPLNVVTQNPENIDDENDPEYNILDDEHEDLEELRMDSEVKVSKKELNALMKELWEYNQMICSDDDDEDDDDDETSAKKRNAKDKLLKDNVKDLTNKSSTSFNLNNENEILFNDKNENIEYAVQIDSNNENEILLDNQSNNSIQINLNNEDEILLDNQNENIECTVKTDSNNENEVIEVIIKPLVSMYEQQRLLFFQQLKQHIQMLISYYLLSYNHPMIDRKYSNDYESMILFWENYMNNYEFIEDKSFNHFMNHVMDLMKTWKNIMNDLVKCKKISNFIKEEIEKVSLNQNKKILYRPHLPPEMICVCKESKAFLYPLLLPSHGFIPNISELKRYSPSISESEAMLLVIGWDQYNNSICKVDLPNNPNYYTMLKYLAENKTPVWSKNILQKFFKRSLESDQPNVIKYYYANGKYPNINHFVIPLNPTMLKLKQQPYELLPEKWRTYLKNKV